MANYYSDEKFGKIINNIKKIFPDYEPSSSIKNSWDHLRYRDNFPEDYADGDVTAEDEIDDFRCAFEDLLFLFENLEKEKK